MAQGMSAAEHTTKIICVGINPAFDVTMRLASLRCGEVSRVYDETKRAAGKALNVAETLLRADAAAEYACLLGEDNIGAYTARLEELGIIYEAVVCPGATRENLTLLVDGEDKEYKINREGFRAGRKKIDMLSEIIIKRLTGYDAGGKIAIFSGSMPPGVTEGDYAAMMAAAKDAGAALAIDTEALSADTMVSLSPWLYKPNGEELCRLLGMERTEDANILTDAAVRLGRRGVENILLTLGADGLVLVSGYGGNVERVYASPKKLNDTTGAGDRALAGFTAAWCAGREPRQCAEEASYRAENI